MFGGQGFETRLVEPSHSQKADDHLEDVNVIGSRSELDAGHARASAGSPLRPTP
jgi:hypothetical protein